MEWIDRALKEGGLFAVAVVCLSGTVGAVRIFIWLYKRILDRNDTLVDRAHNKSEGDMKIVADLRATVDRQADAIEAMADEVSDLKELIHRLLEQRGIKVPEKTGTDDES